MTRLALISAAALLLPAAAFAQNAGPAAPAAPQPGVPTRLPLAAMRHQQPRASEVDERERDTFGPREVQVQKQRQNEVDQLYDRVMRQSAPPGQR